MNFQKHAFGTLVLDRPVLAAVRRDLEYDAELLSLLRESPDCSKATAIGVVHDGWAPFMSSITEHRIIVGVQWLVANGLGHFLAKGLLTQ